MRRALLRYMGFEARHPILAPLVFQTLFSFGLAVVVLPLRALGAPDGIQALAVCLVLIGVLPFVPTWWASLALPVEALLMVRGVYRLWGVAPGRYRRALGAFCGFGAQAGPDR